MAEKKTVTKKTVTKKTVTKKKGVKKKGAKKRVSTKVGATKVTRNNKQVSDTSDAMPDHSMSSQESSPQSSHASTSVESGQSSPMTGQTDSGSTMDGSGGRNVVSWIALLLSGLALGVGGVVWYLAVVGNVGQQESRFNALEQRIDGFDAMQSDNDNTVSRLKDQFAQLEEGFSKQLKTIQNDMVARQSDSQQAANTQADDFLQQLNTLSDAIVKLRTEQGRDLGGRTLEQVEQLIFMAQQQAQLGGQFAGVSSLASRALQDADALLQKLADPALNQVRQLLAREITALDEVKVIDTIGVLNKLSVLSSTAENLVLAGDIAEPDRVVADSEQAAPTPSEPSEESSMDRYVQPISDAVASFLSGLGDLIQVEKNDKSVNPVISAAVRQMTYQRTQLLLSSAQIAFIRQQPELYQNRIHATRSWVAENFTQDADQTVRWLARLDAVGLLSPQAEIPDISESLNALRVLIKSRNSQVGVEPNQAE